MSWIRLNMIVEGQTEEHFVKNVLEEYLARFGIGVTARCVETSRDKKCGRIYRGGLLSYEKAKKDIIRWLREDKNSDARFTTMFDLYALPDDFPERQECIGISDPQERIARLEQAFDDDISDPRFLPYIQLHEFEALVLVDPQKLGLFYPEKTARSKIDRLSKLVKEKFNGKPETINDGPETAPSKRIIKEFEDYNKVIVGAGTVKEIGMERLLEKCPHFAQWIQKLKHLSN